MKITSTSTLLLLFLSISQTQAESNESPRDLQYYDIEVILFEDAQARYLNSEQWDLVTNEATITSAETGNIQTNRAAAVKAALPQQAGRNFQNIKPSILNRQYARINNSSEYNIMLYAAWRQPGLNDSEAFEIRLDELDNAHKTRSENSIDGHFKLILTRYLHIYGQLQYQRKVSFENAAANSDALDPEAGKPDNHLSLDQPYPITVYRRMRSKELHYIDHPLLGMLIKINPVEKTKEATN